MGTIVQTGGPLPQRGVRKRLGKNQRKKQKAPMVEIVNISTPGARRGTPQKPGPFGPRSGNPDYVFSYKGGAVRPRAFADNALVGRKSGAQFRGKANPYLATLVNPEAFPGVRYPDSFSRKTAMVQLILEQELFYFPADSIIELAGSYLCIWRPSLVHPFWSYGVTNSSSYPNWSLTTPTDRFGLRPLVRGMLTPTLQDDQQSLQHDVIYNLKIPMIYSNVDYVLDPFSGKASDGSEFWGHVFALGGATDTINFNAIVAGPTLAGDILTFYATNGTTTLSVNVVAALNQLSFSMTLDITALMMTDASSMGLGKVAPRPGIGFRVMWTSGASRSNALLSLNMVSSSAAAPQVQLGYTPLDFPDQQQFLELISQYRPVSSSAWVGYEGSDLNNGGQHSAIMFGGGEHPNTVGLYTFQKIATTPTGYEDKMRKGTYQYTVPFNVGDVTMRAPVNSEEWTHPYCVIAGQVSTAGQLNALRMRGVMNMEFISDSQLWQYSSVRPNPGMIAHATAMLAGCPTTLSNDSHLKEIWSWLKQAAKDTIDFVEDNKSWIIPAVTAVAGALMK